MPNVILVLWTARSPALAINSVAILVAQEGRFGEPFAYGPILNASILCTRPEVHANKGCIQRVVFELGHDPIIRVDIIKEHHW